MYNRLFYNTIIRQLGGESYTRKYLKFKWKYYSLFNIFYILLEMMKKTN